MRTVQLPAIRATALFLGLFTLVNLIASWGSPGSGPNVWWIDTRFLPGFLGRTLLLAGAGSLLVFATGRATHPSVRNAIGAVCCILAAVAALNTLTFLALWRVGRITPGLAIPLSLPMTLVLVFIAQAAAKPPVALCGLQRGLYALSFLAALILFPLAQMAFFGATDYRRNADAIVVFGARAYANGTPSQALHDRVRTAVELYHEGRAPLLIFSGGPGDGSISEPQSMRNVAVSLGVPAEVILLDEQGLNTQATVANTVRIFRERGISRALAVSHDYHLPRIKLTYQQALAVAPHREVFTVPAYERQPLTARPIYMAREVLALGLYYVRSLAHPLS